MGGVTFKGLSRLRFKVGLGKFKVLSLRFKVGLEVEELRATYHL
jgi:hypothetical protein